jgi:hypothetical protein
MHSRSSAPTLLLAAAITVLLANPGHAQAPTLCDQSLTSTIAEMYERIKGLPGASVAPSRNPDFDVIDLGSQGELWNFTKASHPAHPSVACRRLVQVEGELRVETQLRCNAAKAQCDRLAADYAALDKQMMDAIKREAPKR